MTALARLSLRFRTVTLLVVVLLLGAGAFAASRLTQELFPPIDAPFLVVSATQPGAGPNAVSTGMARPLEDAIRATEGLNHVASTSIEGAVIITAEYDFGTDMAARQREVREAVATVELPGGVATPEVQRISPNTFPVYAVAVSGPDEVALRRFVGGELVPALAQQPGVGDVGVAGGAVQTVAVVVDPARLAAAGLTHEDLLGALRAAELSVPVGGIAADGVLFPVRVATSVADVDEIATVPVLPAGGGDAVALGDVATVAARSGGAGQTLSRLDGRPAITVEIVKSQDANTVGTVDAVTDALAEIELPAGIVVEEVVNQAPEISEAVSSLAVDAVLGVVLAIIAILVFLRSTRGTLVTGVSIPLSLLVAFIVMHATGISLNILTLGALSVAAARVIDDAIVVFENIHRLLDEGDDRTEAVVVGTGQMVPAITASTLTTVAVFLPLAFVGGLVGEVFAGFALTVTFALLASLLVAVTVIPVLAQTFLRATHLPGEPPAERGDVQELRLRAVYRRPLLWALSHRGLTVGLAVVLLVASLATTTGIPVNLFPSSETQALSVRVTAAPGSSLEATAEQVAAVERGLADLEGIERFTTVVGTSSDNPVAALSGGGGGGASAATLTVDLDGSVDADELARRIDGLVDDAELDGAVTEQGNQNGPNTSNVSVQVTGRDFDDVVAATDVVRDAIGGIDGIEEVTSNVARSRPELVVDVDGMAAAARGFDTAAIAAVVRATLTPTPATTITVDGEPREVLVVTDPRAVSSPEALARVPLGPGVVLGDVATVERADSPTAVTRYDGNRSAEVTGVITDTDVGGINADIVTALEELDLPPGVETTQGGAAELMGDSFSSLLVAMAVAVALVYLCMVAAFGSLLTPFVILLTLPLAAIGAFPALLVTGRELGLPAMLGLLMLIGIVVTNAIVMLEFVERLRRERGLSTFDALVEGAQTRLRPVLMTAVVTILALVPLALGLSDGAVLSASLATVVIGGLLSSTLLTLLVIPAVYSLFDGLKRRFDRGGRTTPPDDVIGRPAGEPVPA